jgi:N-acetylmuramoyl-L-alanine amidase
MIMIVKGTNKTIDLPVRMKCGRKDIYSLIIFFFMAPFFLCSNASGAGSHGEVKGLRHWTTSEYIRIVVDMSGPVEFTKNTLHNPERLFFDLKDTKVLKSIQPVFNIGDKLLKSVRIGQYNADTVRIVFDLESPDYEYKIVILQDPSRIVIDVFSKGGKGGGTEEKPNERTEASLVRKKVVLDPGHGGHDSGAVGPHGLMEKDVVLDIALMVRDIMKGKYPIYDIVLTRDTDEFIELKDRAKVANNMGADLFLSIHANASPNRHAKGIETYFLNWTDDEAALKVAARENAISVNKMKRDQGELGIILASLNRDRKRDDSMKLADTIHQAVVTGVTDKYPKAKNLGIKFAPFFVLVDADMASALAEVSFISNPEEEKMLSSKSYKHEIAESIAEGINRYFATAPQQRIVSNLPGSASDSVLPVKYSVRR